MHPNFLRPAAPPAGPRHQPGGGVSARTARFHAFARQLAVLAGLATLADIFPMYRLRRKNYRFIGFADKRFKYNIAVAFRHPTLVDSAAFFKKRGPQKWVPPPKIEIESRIDLLSKNNRSPSRESSRYLSDSLYSIRSDSDLQHCVSLSLGFAIRISHVAQDWFGLPPFRSTTTAEPSCIPRTPAALY